MRDAWKPTLRHLGQRQDYSGGALEQLFQADPPIFTLPNRWVHGNVDPVTIGPRVIAERRRILELTPQLFRCDSIIEKLLRDTSHSDTRSVLCCNIAYRHSAVFADVRILQSRGASHLRAEQPSTFASKCGDSNANDVPLTPRESYGWL